MNQGQDQTSHADALRSSHTDRVLAWLRPKHEDMLIEDIRTHAPAADRKNHAGIALDILCREKLLEDFIGWAVHPVSGFICPDIAVKPLPKAIENVLQEYLDGHNQAMRERNSDLRDAERRYTRRQFFDRLATRAAVGGGCGMSFGAIATSHKPDTRTIGKFTLAGMLAGVVTTPGQEPSYPDIHNPDAGSVDLNRLVTQAGKLLEKLYRHEQQIEGAAR